MHLLTHFCFLRVIDQCVTVLTGLNEPGPELFMASMHQLLTPRRRLMNWPSFDGSECGGGLSRTVEQGSTLAYRKGWIESAAPKTSLCNAEGI